MTETARTTDVFLSYNRADDAAVRAVRDALHRSGLSTFLDWQDLAAGLPWPAKLERALRDSRAVAVFVGPSGLGPWQTREVYFALDLQARSERAGNGDGLPVMAVLLAGAEPPTGFLALNTWVDLRGGVSDSSLSPLLRAIDGAEVSRPALDVCPYRDLRAFREEDAALFFGRDEAIEKLVQRVVASSRGVGELALVAVVGSSGSGKSSVTMAGALPALRRQCPPDVVWDYATFTPGDAPWRRFADALVPLLDPELSEARRLDEAATLTNALRCENGIGSAIQRVLQKSRGTDRLLVVVDQFEELFTLTDEMVAREFVRALLGASRSVPMTVLLTLRSDYYGKAIALDRDLRNALHTAQVILGPLEREELRDIIERPASLVRLSFDPGLVERILDDVSEEPGNLPLLEYALTELWKARSGDRLTFEAYDRIGRVAGALANRANEFYGELSETQRAAARRLMLRLVRVASADEEGADTRRRARREEIDDEAWKLVPFFTSSRARLLVSGTDAASNQDTVEVAHEALIRKWDTLRAWLEEDRRFLLWRQQLAVFRTKWIEGGNDADEGTLLRGALLADAQKWLRTRRAEFSREEQRYIEASARKVVRSRTAWIVAATVVLIALSAVGGWAVYQRTTRAVVDRILEKHLEKYVIADVSDYEEEIGEEKYIIALIRLGRLPQLQAEIAKLDKGVRPKRYAQLAMAIGKAQPKTSLKPFIDRSVKAAGDSDKLLEVAEVLLAAGRKREAVALLHEAEASPKTDLFRLGELWELAGDVKRASSSIVTGLVRIPETEFDKNLSLLAIYTAKLAKYGNQDNALAFAKRLLKRDPSTLPEVRRKEILASLAAVEAATNVPLLVALNGRIPAAEMESARTHAAEMVEKPDVDRWLAGWRKADQNVKGVFAITIVHMLMEQRRFEEAEAVVFDPAVLSSDYLRVLITKFAEVGQLEIAARIAERLRRSAGADRRWLVAAVHADLSASFARAGRKDEASKAYEIALDAASAPKIDEDEKVRDLTRVVLSTALAAYGRHYDALRMADSIEADDSQRLAYLSILREIAAQRR